MSVSSSIGPISGIDYGKLITGLMGIEQKPIDQITARVKTLTDQNTAFNDLATLMTGLKLSALNFTSAGVFRAAQANSSNPGVVSATASVGTPVGNYSFNVQRLASASQLLSQGFTDPNTTPLGTAGKLTLQFGKGRLDDVSKLSDLNGGAGVARGSIKVTDRSGTSALVDLSRAVDINDVVDAINSTTGVSVAAKIDGDKLVITDNSGGAGTLSITNAGGATTAADLGLTAAAVGGTLTGASITNLRGTTSLDFLNNGNGVRNSGILPDFSITGSGGAFNVTINGAKTINDVITKINSASGNTTVTASLSADGHGLTLTDSGAGPVSVSALNNSLAAFDLGFQTGTAAANTLTGARIGGDLASPLLTQLKGGYQGGADTIPTPGTVTINAQSLDISSARSINDVLKILNTNSQGVTASLNNAGTGITLSGTAAFTVADSTGNLASFLNIAGSSTASGSTSTINSGDLRLRYVSDNTSLASLNGGSGIKAGKIRITDGTGASQILDLTSPTITRIGDVITKINSLGLAVTAKVNDTGDGILLTQTSGTLSAKVDEVDGGTTASSLNLFGVFSSNVKDGSFQKSIDILATDKLSDVATKINNAGLGVAAAIINDGSSSSPYRLNLSSRNSGAAGQLIFDGSAIGISTSTLLKGQDAVVVYGGAANSANSGLTATSASNTFTGLVPSLSVTLNSVGSATVSVSRDDSKIHDTISSFVDQYNKVVDKVAEDTKFDSTDPTNKGILFGDSTVQQIQQELGFFVGQVFGGIGPVKTFSAVGITIGQDGKLTLNDDKLTSILASNPDDVRSLFTTNTPAVKQDLTVDPQVLGKPAVKGIGALLNDLLDKFTDASTGLIFRSTDALQTQTRELNDRSSALNDLLALKKDRLIRQFANLEVNIASLQQQSSSLTSIKSTTSS